MARISRRKVRVRARPPTAVTRLSLYLRQLELLQRAGIEVASSERLAEALGISDAQVRRDLASFGQYGLRGQGYRCDELIRGIRRILGTDERWPVALAGFGNLGRALVGYAGFRTRGFQIVLVLDNDPRKIGQQAGPGLVVEPAEQTERLVQERGVRLGILAVPAASAQRVAEAMVAGGVEGLLNFAPTQVRVPGIPVASVDLTVELETLAFLVQWSRRESASRHPARD